MNAGERGESSSRGKVRTRGICSGERNLLSISSDISNMLFYVTRERWMMTGRVCRGGKFARGRVRSGLFVR